MIRKCVAAFLAMVIAVGAVFAEEVKGTFVKFADGKLTLKVDDKEKEFKVPADLKQKRKGKDGTETEIEVSKMFGRFKEGTPITIDAEKGEVKSVKFGGGRKKKDN